ncbi:MAG: HAMP domain-containing protein [Proteobacteria bacterium]|nr:HAMP domain-containing protein [Pseudomonadota bacterium]
MRSYKFYSSVTFKIFAAMLLIAVVPVVATLVIFDRISEFNQDLQEEAAESIDGVSEIYRAWVKAESSRIELIQKNLALQTDALLDKHQVVRVADIFQSHSFQQDLQKLFDETVASDAMIADIRLIFNMEPVVQASRSQMSRSEYNFQAVTVPVAIYSRFANRAQFGGDLPADETIPVLIAQPVGDSGTLALPDTLPDSQAVLPETMRGHAENDAPMASTRGVHLVLMFAIEKAQNARYEQLGEKRYRHGAISAMQADETTRVTSLYQAIFFSIAALVFILAIGAAFFIAFPISQRISALTEKTKLLADGDLNAKVHVKGKDQIAFLMTQFNTMVDDVRTAQESKAYIERMQAWQEVARRLAHEIKNPLTPIVLAVQQLDKKFDDYIDRPQKYRKLLTDAVEIVNEETGTLHKLVKNFSEFARMPIPEKKDTCLYEFVRQTVEQNPQFAEQTQRITIHEATETAAHAHIDIDHELMRRVLVNIIRNGIEAAQNAQFEPEIDIEVSHLENDAHHQLNIRILDNGPGLTDEQKAKLFMPYFTTKSDGTGLGLPIVRKIIEDHDGRIHLGNREDGQRGTQADISL